VSGDPTLVAEPPSLTVVIPVYDESPRIESLVDEILAELRDLPYRHHLLIVNDGSNDWSPELERRLADKGPVLSRSFYPNSGKGAVLDRTLPTIDTDFTLVIDADGEYTPKDIPAVVEPLVRDEADWVLGTRYGFGRPRPRQYLATYLVNRIVNLWLFVLSGTWFRDVLTGIYAFRTDVVAGIRLRERRFAYTAELTWKLLRRRGIRRKEVPASYRFRSYADGKKIRWWEAGTLVLAMLRYGFPGGDETRDD